MNEQEYETKVIELLEKILQQLESVERAVNRVESTLDSGITVYEPR